MSQQPYIDLQAVNFKKGATFSFILQLPSIVEEGQLVGWSLKAQIRKQGNDQASGFISDLEVTWVDEEKATSIRAFHQNTEDWPVGILEFDVIFTAPIDPENPTVDPEIIKSATVYVNVLRSITE